MWPTIRAGALAVVAFGAALWMTREFAESILLALAAYPRLAVMVFVASSALAVLLPVMSNLALVPLAVLAWGPAWAAGLLLLGWVVGAALSFTLARHARPWLLRHFPTVQRHSDIDRLIHPEHRIGSLILLRMTFPVDVLSYALGLFSRRATWLENLASTLVGGAPFAIVFSVFPTLGTAKQVTLFLACTVVFLLHLAWVLRHEGASDDTGSR